MVREIEYNITTEYENLTINAFLREKGYSSRDIIKLKKDISNIRLNGEPSLMKAIMKSGDTMIVHIEEQTSSEKIPPVKLPFPVVYEDEDILVVDKPADMPIHPSMNNYENTLGNAAAYYFQQKGESFIYRCVNRLDRDTTGLTILAKHFVSAGILYEEMQERRIHRIYIAIVEDHDLPDSGTIDKPIARKDASVIERCVDFEKGERAVTHFKVVNRFNKLALVEFNLETGRTHQIRVHMASIGCPLIGDFLYNPENKDMKRQALHGYKLEFTHPILGVKMKFEAPIPEDMRKVMWYETEH